MLFVVFSPVSFLARIISCKHLLLMVFHYIIGEYMAKRNWIFFQNRQSNIITIEVKLSDNVRCKSLMTYIAKYDHLMPFGCQLRTLALKMIYSVICDVLLSFITMRIPYKGICR